MSGKRKPNYIKIGFTVAILAIIILFVVLIIKQAKIKEEASVSSVSSSEAVSSKESSVESVVTSGNESSTEPVVTSSKESSEESSEISTNESSNESSRESSEASSKTPSDTSSEESSKPAVTPEVYNPTGDWRLILVNKEHILPSDYSVPLSSVDSTYKFHSDAVADLKKLLRDAKNAGINLRIISTYRSYQTSNSLFTNKVNAYINSGMSKSKAKAEAAKIVAPPGTSDHHTGLACDMVSSDWYNYNSDLNDKFEDTDEFKWLISNCANYGFILRFPKGKESATSIDYEPWHYRYVGRENAKKIMDEGLCLEEYIKKYYE